MNDTQRERLAAAQAELLRAVLADGAVPAGFDERRLKIEARSLLAKRRGIVAMLDPEVADALGERFRPLFDGYARAHPRRSGSRAREDAADFAHWAREQGELPPVPRRRWWRKT